MYSTVQRETSELLKGTMRVFFITIVLLGIVTPIAGNVHFEQQAAGPLPPVALQSPTTFPGLELSDDELGILNVAAAPYNADPTGASDSTQAIQQAILDGREQSKAVYLPLGSYLISDTLNNTEHSRGRFRPVVMVGETNRTDSLNRPTIFIADNTAGFTSASKPRYIVHFWEDSSLPPEEILQDQNLKENVRSSVEFNQIFQGINIRVGKGNFGAVGIRLRGAQGSNIENSLIDLGEDGFIGVVGASGSGGSHAGITVIGGKYGLDFRMAQPAPTITGAHLVNQSCASLVYAGLQTLTIVGAYIENHGTKFETVLLGQIASVPPQTLVDDSTQWLPKSGPCYLPVLEPDVQPAGPADSGQISIIDSAILVPNSNCTALTTPRNLYMRNVYVHGSTKIAKICRNDSQTDCKDFLTPGTFTQWLQIEEAVFAVDPPITSRWSGKVILQFESTLWMNGQKVSGKVYVSSVQKNVSPPADLMSRHMWSEAAFPSFQSEKAVSVKQRPYNAKGDGLNDDTAAIRRAIEENEIVLLPKGKYLVSSTLTLKADTKLVGVGRTITRLHCPQYGLNSTVVGTGAPEAISPIVESYAGSGNTVVAFMTITTYHRATNTYAFHCRTQGAGCVYRQTFCWTAFFGFMESTQRGMKQGAQGALPPPPNSSLPLLVISGGGKFYTVENEDYTLQAPSYRHVLVENSTAGLNFYQLNTEHSRGESNTEIRWSSNVQIFGMKSEGDYPVLWIRDSHNVTLYGYGGQASAFPLNRTYPVGYAQFTPSLFRVENCSDTRLINLVDYPRVGGGNQSYFEGQGFNPHTWSMVLDVTNNITSPPMDRPVIYGWN